MRETFELKPLGLVLSWIIIIHLLAGVMTSLFVITMEIKILLACLVALHGIWQFRGWAGRRWHLQFDANRQLWNVAMGERVWKEVTSVQPVYINDRLIWLKFVCAGRSLTVIADANSVSNQKFMQLRRSVICPTALTTGSI